ncbi:hypothetical protein ACWCZ5_12245 [Streptomyces sp. NPDC001667]
MNASTVDVQSPAIEVLYRILDRLPHRDLPAAHFETGMMVLRTDIALGVRITVHGSLGSFEIWREALGIDPAAVEWRENRQSTAAYELLEGEGAFAGVPVILSGLARLAPAPVDPVTPAV